MTLREPQGGREAGSERGSRGCSSSELSRATATKPTSLTLLEEYGGEEKQGGENECARISVSPLPSTPFMVFAVSSVISTAGEVPPRYGHWLCDIRLEGPCQENVAKARCFPSLIVMHTSSSSISLSCPTFVESRFTQSAHNFLLLPRDSSKFPICHLFGPCPYAQRFHRKQQGYLINHWAWWQCFIS